MTILLGLLAFSVIGSNISCFDFPALADSPLNYLIDNFNPSGLIYCTFPYGAVLWPAGESNMGGTLNRAYFIPLDGFSSFPALPVSPATAEEFHTLEGELVLETDCNVIELYTTYKTGTLKSDTEGEIDGKYFKLTPEFFHPGSKAEIINFSSYCINTPGILFLPESEGVYMVVGSPGHPVYLSPAFDMAKVGEGRKGTAFTGEAYSQLILTKFKGTLPLVAPLS